MKKSNNLQTISCVGRTFTTGIKDWRKLPENLLIYVYRELYSFVLCNEEYMYSDEAEKSWKLLEEFTDYILSERGLSREYVRKKYDFELLT